MLQLDISLVYQIVLFAVLWLVLKRWWFDPALAVVRERTLRSEGALAEARAVREEAARLRREHEQALAQARLEAQREVQEILRASEQEQRRLIEEATTDAEQTLRAARARIAEDIAAARRSLHGEVDALAQEVARVVLGRPVRS